MARVEIFLGIISAVLREIVNRKSLSNDLDATEKYWMMIDSYGLQMQRHIL